MGIHDGGGGLPPPREFSYEELEEWALRQEHASIADQVEWEGQHLSLAERVRVWALERQRLLDEEFEKQRQKDADRRLALTNWIQYHENEAALLKERLAALRPAPKPAPAPVPSPTPSRGPRCEIQ